MQQNTLTTDPAVAGAEEALNLLSKRAALWGASLHEGLMVSDFDGQRPARVLEAWGGGCLELLREVCAYVDVLQAQVHAAPPRPPGYPGVFEYEVVAGLGRRLGDYLLTHNGQLPERAAVEALCRELVLAFFDPPEGGD